MNKVLALAVALSVVGVTATYTLPSSAETVTIVVALPADVCEQPRVAKRGDDLFIRCSNKGPDEFAFRWTNYPKTCPNPRATKDPQGNLVVRCG